ncbi:MAG: flippase [Gemmatimonadetes bacterium]|nr:flippase [Gemmatimonadota bacterium]
MSFSKLTNSRVLARNAIVNFLGSGAPLIVALVAIPLLVKGLGTERFGILTVSWVVIGYLSLFDLGLGRALTKLVAERLGTQQQDEIPAITWTGLFLMMLLGIVGALVLAALSPWLTGNLLKIPPALQEESLRAFYLLALSLPVVISTAGLRGILEANQSFGLVNAIRIPMGVFTYLGPLAVVVFSRSLVAVVAVLVAGRVIAWLAHLILCLRVFPSLRRRFVLHREYALDLVRFGGWMTISNIVSPFMTYVDRFIVGALISMSAVAYYSTPYEMVTKIWIIPSALMGVLFPAFATTFVSDRGRTSQLFEQGVRLIFLVTFPVTLVVVTLAHEALYLWLGSEFAVNSTRVLQWLAAGVFINCLAQVPFAVLQGVGRPDLVGKLHLLELPAYGVLLWAVARTFGLEGVAIAWVVRMAADTVLLFLLAERSLPTGSSLVRRTGMMTAPALLALAGAAVLSGLGLKVAFLTGSLVGFGLLAWRYILAPNERALVQRAVSPA